MRPPTSLQRLSTVVYWIPIPPADRLPAQSRLFASILKHDHTRATAPTRPTLKFEMDSYPSETFG
jgi:hypothetical protein